MNANVTRQKFTRAAVTNVSRRGVLLGLAAGTFALSVQLPGRASAEEKLYGGAAMPGGVKDDPRIFLTIEEDGTVRLLCNRAEMGQGVRTGWVTVIADELEADLAQIKVEQAPGNEALYGNQNTDGSRSMRHHFQALRRIGAAARTMLEQEAAERWGVPLQEVQASGHKVTHATSDQSLGFGELARAAAERDVPATEDLRLKAPEDFQHIGKEDFNNVDNQDITTGKPIYGIDKQLDGLVYAVVARPPVYGGKVKSYDDAEARKVPGVIGIFELDSPDIPSAFLPLGGIAVVAENTFAANKARLLLEIEWDAGDNQGYDSAEYRKTLEAAAEKPGKVMRDDGDVDAALPDAAKQVTASYYLPHLAHASMEPPSATARFADGKCEVWTSVQAPEALRSDLIQRFELAPENAVVHTMLLGGGFGRKSKPDYASEAAIISKTLDGRPVKLTFTREDDIQHDYFHTVSVERLDGGLDENGKTVAWRHRTVAPSIGSVFEPGVVHQAPFELGMGAVDNPFDIPNLRVENPEAAAHTRIGWLRSVYNIPHAFAVQCFAAELAEAAGRDHKEYLLELLGPDREISRADMNDTAVYGENPELYPYNTARLRKVIEAVTQAAGWGRDMPEGRGLGLAAHHSFVSYTAVVVEVEVKDGALIFPRVDIAFDCGAVISPDRVRAQLEGSVVQGVSLAMLGEISFKDGIPEQSNFDGYELTRIDESPVEIHTHLVPSLDYDSPLGGVGEPGLPPVAPAIANAIFAATGKRIRALPIRDQFA